MDQTYILSLHLNASNLVSEAQKMNDFQNAIQKVGPDWKWTPRVLPPSPHPRFAGSLLALNHKQTMVQN